MKAITYVLLENLWLSANLSPFCYSAYKTCTHKAKLTRTAALLLMGSIIISVACVREYSEMWKVYQREKERIAYSGVMEGWSFKANPLASVDCPLGWL